MLIGQSGRTSDHMENGVVTPNLASSSHRQ